MVIRKIVSQEEYPADGYSIPRPDGILKLLRQLRDSALLLEQEIVNCEAAKEEPVLNCYKDAKAVSDVLYRVLVTVEGGTFEPDGQVLEVSRA